MQCDELPTKLVILEHVLWKISKEKTISRKDPQVSEIVLQVGKEVQEIWRLKGMPCVTLRTIKERIQTKFQEYKKIIRQSRLQRPPKDISTTWDNFKKGAQSFFDISTCKCKKRCLCTPQLNKSQVRMLSVLRSDASEDTEDTEEVQFTAEDLEDGTDDPDYVPPPAAVVDGDEDISVARR